TPPLCRPPGRRRGPSRAGPQPRVCPARWEEKDVRAWTSRSTRRMTASLREVCPPLQKGHVDGRKSVFRRRRVATTRRRDRCLKPPLILADRRTGGLCPGPPGRETRRIGPRHPEGVGE